MQQINFRGFATKPCNRNTSPPHLREREEQRQIAPNALQLERLRGLDALPRGREMRVQVRVQRYGGRREHTRVLKNGQSEDVGKRDLKLREGGKCTQA